MPNEPSGSFQEKQRKHWNAVADGWAAWLGWIERNFSPLTAWCRDAAGWQAGARVLDVACGAGYPALAAAASVGPAGAVVATDISPEMLAVASRQAGAAGLENIEFLEMDAERLQFPDDSFDAVTNVYGLMFCPDPVRAVGEAWRVLKPGGRAGVVVWDGLANSPYFSVITEVAARLLSLPPPDPGAPGPFRLAPAATLASTLREGGFAGVRVDSLTLDFQCRSVAEYCQIFGDLAWKTRMASLTDDERTRFAAAVGAAAEPYVQPDGRLILRAVSLCAAARKESAVSAPASA